MSTGQKTSSISIIIPTLNEEDTIGNLLSTLQEIPETELLVVDGGSTDRTVALAGSMGAKVLTAGPGKASQMNAGAEAARSDILLFLHSDTILSPGFATQIVNVLQQPGVVAGAFSMAIAGRGVGLRLLEHLINFRSRALQMPYGDQALFMTTGVFSAVDRFPLLPIMEDFELVRKLRRRGKIRILPLKATTSARRWKKLGLLRTTLRNQGIIIGYFLGVSPEKLAAWYRRG